MIRRSANNRGSVYAVVLLIVALVCVLGLSSVSIATSRVSATAGADDRQEASLLARSAIERALWAANNESSSSQKEDIPANDAVKEQAVLAVNASDIVRDQGTTSTIRTPRLTDQSITYEYLDREGTTPNSFELGSWIYGRGESGDAVWIERARMRLDEGRPLAPLRTAMHTTEGIFVQAGASVSLTGGPISTDTSLVNNGHLDGAIEAKALSGRGTETSANESSRGAKGALNRGLMGWYIAWASELNYEGDLNGEIIAPGISSLKYDALNPEGIYFIDTGGNDLDITNSRIAATLVIDASPGGTVTIGPGVVIEAPFEGRPALLVKGDLVFNGDGSELTETFQNMNPDGAPSAGEIDSDQADAYEPVIRGLVYVFGRATLNGTLSLQGSLVVDGWAEISGDQIELTYDPGLLRVPPRGTGENPESDSFMIVPGSWSRISVSDD